MSPEMDKDLNRILDWYEEEPSRWVAIFTGTGDKAFGAGADLKAWNVSHKGGNKGQEALDWANAKEPRGFGGLALRRMSKPIIAALNGSAFGGGAEMTINCDIIVMADSAVIGLPEPKRGVVAISGGIVRLMRACGSKLAAEALLTGRNIPAKEAKERFNIVNSVVPQKQVMATALDWAKQITDCSPEAVQYTKAAMSNVTLDAMGDNEAVKAAVNSKYCDWLYGGKNIGEGLAAFSERRDPKWTDPKPLGRQSKL